MKKVFIPIFLFLFIFISCNKKEISEEKSWEEFSKTVNEIKKKQGINTENKSEIQFQKNENTKIPEEFLGTYIPMNFELFLKSEHSYTKALYQTWDLYTLLMLQNDICYSDLNFHDGYAIDNNLISKWKYIKDNENYYIIDEKGRLYKRINTDGSYNGYEFYAEYVLTEIFKDAKHKQNIKLTDGFVYIDDEQFTLVLDMNFLEAENDCIWLTNGKQLFVLKIEGLTAKIYETESIESHHGIKETDKIYKEIPMFYWNDENYPDLDISKLNKNDLRLLRNLIYAKHGYQFKSEDLKQIYENFDWYKVNPNFKESSFNEKEVLLKDSIINKEK